MPTDHLIPPVEKLNDEQLLKKVAVAEFGGNVSEMLNHFVTDCVVPGICTTCHAIEISCEPDARENTCGNCDADTVRSILDLAGVI